MAAPKGSAPSKAFYVAVLAFINQLVSDGVVSGSTTITDTITAVEAEIAAR